MDKYTENRIKEAADANIVEVIGSYVDLKKRGSDFVGICPFHNDSTPSLHVSEAKHCWTCFACGATGDCIKFVMKYENCDYVAASRIIADILHIYVDAAETLHNPTKRTVRPIMPNAYKKATETQEMAEIPSPFLVKSMKHTGRLFDYLFPYIGTCYIAQVWDDYCVGATADGKEVFWCISAENKIRYGKVMDYDTNGHRRHENGSCFAIHPILCKYLKKHGLWAQDYEPTFKPILFGGHLIADNPQRPIAIVESEKTAIIGACLVPSLTWCAVGGKNSLNADMIAPCKGHLTFLFADFDARNEWTEKCQQLRQQGFDIAVMPWWAGIENVGEKWDIADLLLRDLQVIDKFTDEQWEAMEYLEFEDESQQPTPQTRLNEMMSRNPALALLVDSLQLEIVDEEQPNLSPMQQSVSGYRIPLKKVV